MLMSKTVYRGKHITVEEERMPIKGKEHLIEKVLLPKVVVVVPFLDKDTVLMEMHYRPVIDKHILELPAGKVEIGEKPKAAAGRELTEETGYKAGKLEFLFRAYSSPGVTTEDEYFFKATNLKKAKQNLEEGEDLDLKPIKLNELLRMIKRNEIDDLKTIAGIIYTSTS